MILQPKFPFWVLLALVVFCKQTNKKYCRFIFTYLQLISFHKSFFLKKNCFFSFDCKLLYANFPLVVVRGAPLQLRYAGLSLWWLPLLLSMGSSYTAARQFSSCGPQDLERTLRSCGAQACLPCSMWNLPRPGIKRVSPAWADGFMIAGQPGKPFYKSFECLV